MSECEKIVRFVVKEESVFQAEFACLSVRKTFVGSFVGMIFGFLLDLGALSWVIIRFDFEVDVKKWFSNITYVSSSVLVVFDNVSYSQRD